MRDRWQWAEPIWRRSFAPLVDAGYTLERVDGDAYWRTHEEQLRQHFPPEVFFHVDRLRGADHSSRRDELVAATPTDQLADHCIVRRDGQLAAVFSGRATSSDVYRMSHTAVHPSFRRRGIYDHVLRGTIDYTRELGFDTIASEHAPGNNPVLIAKLRAGFRITGLDVSPMVGTSVHLTYFHHPDQLAAYQFRCGLATLNPRIVASGFGAMPDLLAQMSVPGASGD